MSSAHKSHKPTKKKIDEARRQGKVVKSQVLTQSLSFLIGLLGVYLISTWTWVNIQILLKYCIVSGVSEPLGCFQEGGALVLKVVLGVLIGGAFTGLVIELIQVGFKVEPKILAIRWSRLDPVSGIKRVFSDGWKRSLEIFLRGMLIVSVFYYVFDDLSKRAFTIFFVSHGSALQLISVVLVRVASVGAGLLLFCGAVDYFLRRRQFFREQSMSTEEVRRELKDDEGDPMLKALRKHQHEALLMQDLVRRVRASKVIVTETQ